MTSITPDDAYDWQDQRSSSSWLGVTVAFVTVLLAVGALTLL
jgi:hypothetical protein